MSNMDRRLRRWEDHGVIDAPTIARIREFERGRSAGGYAGWAVRIAATFGALLLAAGILLFVSARWELLSPLWRTAIIMATVIAFRVGSTGGFGRSASVLPLLPWELVAVGWIAAIGAPLVLAAWNRGKSIWWNVAATAWVVTLCHVPVAGGRVTVYIWMALGSVALAAWGLVERRVERINMATACFALTVMVFYFDSFADKLGRAAALAGLGVLFLGGGYLLERARRRLIAHAREGSAV